ncbi:hypothetical protein PR048_008433 [Dryococelus australis]|uniref:Uncharacterized protein n=1 Tax=Dryococelus australis TaxID=614101 RepID=A0ABQ9HXW3_9NEOP|nr:hypothetical protein PR048_008433 [Dryococelus australis]
MKGRGKREIPEKNPPSNGIVRHDSQLQKCGYPRQNPPINVIARYDSHMRKSGVTKPGIELIVMVRGEQGNVLGKKGGKDCRRVTSQHAAPGAWFLRATPLQAGTSKKSAIAYSEKTFQHLPGVISRNKYQCGRTGNRTRVLSNASPVCHHWMDEGWTPRDEKVANRGTTCSSKYQWRDVMRSKVSWCLLSALHTRRTQQEPVTRVEPAGTECTAATHERATRSYLASASLPKTRKKAPDRQALKNENIPHLRLKTIGMTRTGSILKRRAPKVMCDVEMAECVLLHQESARLGGGGVAGRLTWSPPTKANRAQSPRPEVTPGYSEVGIVPDDAAGRRVFLGDLSFPPPLHSYAAPSSPHFTLIGLYFVLISLSCSPVPSECLLVFASCSRLRGVSDRAGWEPLRVPFASCHVRIGCSRGGNTCTRATVACPRHQWRPWSSIESCTHTSHFWWHVIATTAVSLCLLTASTQWRRLIPADS